MKWLLKSLLAIIVLAVIAAIVLPFVLDPNDYKDDIELKVQEKISRPIHLNGEIKWSVFPWLALTFSDVIIENDKGFNDQSLAKIAELSARVKLLPLFKKEIQVGHIEINGADLQLQINKQGKSNWQGIIDSLNKGQKDKQDDAGTSKEIKIAGISLDGVNANYSDKQNNTSFELSQFELSTTAINSTEPVSIDTSLRLFMPESGLEVDIETDIIATNILSDKGILLDLNELSVSGKLNKDSTIPLNISLLQGGEIDLTKDSLNLLEIQIIAGDAKLTTNLLGSNLTKQIALSGSYQLKPFDLNSFVEELSGAPLTNSDVLSDFSSQGQWQLNGNSMKIKDLSIIFDKTKIQGTANISDVERLKGRFNVAINQLNIDQFLTDKAQENKTSTGKNTSTALQFGQLSGTVKIDTLFASGTQMKNIEVKVKTNGNSMRLDPVTADFYQGQLLTSVAINTMATNNKVKVNHSMKKIQAGPLLTDLAGSQLLTGIGDLKIDLNIDEPFSELPLKTANGQISYQLGDGAIYGIDVFGMIQKGFAMLYPEIAQKETSEEKKTSFALMQLEADVNAGILTTRVLSLESPYLRVTGQLTIDLVAMQIKGTLEPMLLDIPEQMVSEKYKKLLNLAIPVSLKGSLLEPDIAIDYQKLLLATQKERINKEKEKLKGKLLDSLFGKKSNKTQQQGNKAKQEQ